MSVLRVDITVDEAVARAIPALRPLIGKRVKVVVLDSEAPAQAERILTVDEFLASRIKLSRGVARQH